MSGKVSLGTMDDFIKEIEEAEKELAKMTPAERKKIAEEAEHCLGKSDEPLDILFQRTKERDAKK